MSESVEYWMDVVFFKKKDATDFSKEQKVRSFFDEVTFQSCQKEVICIFRGKLDATFADEHLKAVIGDVIEKYKDAIDDFTCSVSYLDHIPQEEIEMGSILPDEEVAS